MVDYLVDYVRIDVIHMCEAHWYSALDDALVKASILRYFVFHKQLLLFVTKALYCVDFPHNVVLHNLTEADCCSSSTPAN
jgi:hypothetical protein